MINALPWLLLFQLLGELLVHFLQWPIPGPVVGMVLLLFALMVRGQKAKPLSKSLQTTANSLLKHLSLLFVPAGTGVILSLDLIADEWLPIVSALLISTFAAMVISAVILKVMTPASTQATVDHD